ncbi:AAA family ATPase [Botrimarina sp.]|uniref:ExeA family protein n=1 Tax=Botrimarina sp. TaxID=2795802 RepID=UPI0032EE2E52
MPLGPRVCTALTQDSRRPGGDMYLQHWGLDRSPFATIAFGEGRSADGREAYPTHALAEATARADYLVSQRRRVGVLLGGHGWGKTSTAAAVAAEQRRNGSQVVLLDAVGVTARELLFRVAEGFDTQPDPGDCQMRLWRRIEDRLAENRWQDRATVLIVDDAEQLGPDSQQQLVRLARLESDPASRWTLLLTTSPESLERLSPPLLHLIDLRIDLAPWDASDTVGYIQTSLVDAGRFEPIFSEAALSLLHELTRGVPRHVARLADFALLAGAAKHADGVDEATIEQAFAEMKWTPGGMALAG